MSASVCVNGLGDTAVTTVRPPLRASMAVTTYPSGTAALAGNDAGTVTGLASFAQTRAAPVKLGCAAIADSSSSLSHPARTSAVTRPPAARATRGPDHWMSRLI